MVIDLEKAVAEQQQYTRRNNIEVVGIPDSINQDLLEEKIIQLAGTMSVTIQSSDIEACHRLKKKRNSNGPDTTIVRFVNRKHAEKIHRSKKNLTKESLTEIGLGKHKIYINNNLCPSYKILMGKASQLFKDKKIFKYWSYNGIINILEKEGQRPRKILHLLDLDQLFDHDFSPESSIKF